MGNPNRNDLARFDVSSGPLYEVYTLGDHKGTRVSVTGGPLTGVYVFDDAMDAMAWCLVQAGWDGLGGVQERVGWFRPHEVPDIARKVES